MTQEDWTLMKDPVPHSLVGLYTEIRLDLSPGAAAKAKENRARGIMKGMQEACVRVVTKISSCRVNTTSRRGIKRLGISFGSIFLLFSNKSSRGPLSL